MCTHDPYICICATSQYMNNTSTQPHVAVKMICACTFLYLLLLKPYMGHCSRGHL